ncbi:hypothetical protein [Thermus phage TSP4]|nr:hypothetical protein [Thermus phage TSP4]
MNEREMIAAGLRFYTRTGRRPRREDFRPPNRLHWEKVLGFDLPSESTVSAKFKGFTNYLRAMGLAENNHARAEELEDAALRHILEVYPHAEVVTANTNAYDLLLGEERVEVKGTALTRRPDTGYLHWTFRLHNRIFSKTVDAVFLVCMDKDLNPVARFEFREHGLKLLDNKSVLTVYADILRGGYSKYAPYLVWKAPLNGDLERYAREPKSRVSSSRT